MFFPGFVRCIALFLPLLCCACATTRPVDVVEKKDFIQMARTMRTEMQSRRLLDKEGFFQEAVPASSDGVAYGEIL